MKVAIVATAMAGLVCEAAAATTVEMEIDVRGTVRTVVIELNETEAPKSCANFEKLCSQGFYDGIAFHRVIPNYIVQVGDPLSKDAAKKSLWGTGGPGYTVPAELGKPHLRGSVAMARIPGPTNPEKESSGSQFYFALRDIPDLDGEYTVFGKVMSGLEAIEEIADLPKDASFNPIDRIEILSTRVRDSDGDRPPAPIPAPVDVAAPAAVLPPMPDLDAASRAGEAEKSIPPPVIPPASAVAAVDPDAVTELAPEATEAPPAVADRGLPPMPKLLTEEDMTPPPAPAANLETADGADRRPVPAPVEMPPAPALVEMPPAAAPAPAPVEMPPAVDIGRGLPPMPKLFTEEAAALPPSVPTPLTKPVSPTPAPDPVAIPKPVDMPRVDPVKEPHRTASAAGNDGSEEGVVTIAEIGKGAPSRSPAPSYRAPAPARPAARPQPPTRPDSAPAPASAPVSAGQANEQPDAPVFAEPPQEPQDPPKRGFLRNLIRRVW